MTTDHDAGQAGGPGPARRDAERTRAAILDAAIEEFSERGLLGGRVDAVVERTSTVKRMVYYYFGSKERLYQAALIESYRRIRQTEGALRLADLDPETALRALVRATLAHQENNAAFVRLVMFENTLAGGAIHLMDDEVRALNHSVVLLLEDLLARGRDAGVFRSGADAPTALDLHQVISSMAFFRVSNRATFRELFGRDMVEGAERDHVLELIETTVLRLVLADPAA
ncbi:MAG: TetR family transcriptional regulator [Actinobacteria bacterium]|nr:TetR family transcriptional regulator [Actinomycetota bacterium]MCG2801886.1 TetR family transcriptional regulator [Cellulomonas sp.]